MSKHREEIAVSIWKRKDLLYRKCVAERKYKTALDALVAMGRMASLYDGKLSEEKQPEVIRVTEKDFGNLKAVGDDSGEASES